MLDEAVSLLVRQAGAGYAARWTRDHLASEEIAWLNTNREDWHERVLPIAQTGIDPGQGIRIRLARQHRRLECGDLLQVRIEASQLAGS